MRLAALLAIGLTLSLARWQCATAAEAQTVFVKLADGRELHGVVDVRSDGEQLWVRQEEGAVVLATAVAWSDVTTAMLAGAAIDVDELRKQGGESATPGPQLADAVVFNSARANSLSGSPGNSMANGRRRRVRSVEIVEACLVNLDRDVEPDGLVVSIAAIDDAGEPVVVRGNFTARLFVESRPAHYADIEFAPTEHWSQPVAARDFAEGLATYELKFRHTAPEWQFDLLPDAQLEVRLGVYGDGNFAASAPVVIRDLNPIRDDRQGFFGRRFMAGELHGRVPASGPMHRDGLWMYWAR